MKNSRLIISLYLLVAVMVIAISVAAARAMPGKGLTLTLILLLAFIALLSLLFLFILNIKVATDVKKDIASTNNHNTPGFKQKTGTGHEVADVSLIQQKILAGLKAAGNPSEVGDLLLKNMAGEFSIVQGIYYMLESAEQVYRPVASYALATGENTPPVHPGSGLTGQAADDGKVVVIHPVPENYRIVTSGLGQASPAYVYIIPFVFEGKTLAILEVSTFRPVDDDRFTALEMMTSAGGRLINEMNNPNE